MEESKDILYCLSGDVLMHVNSSVAVADAVATHNHPFLCHIVLYVLHIVSV
jgi:hypothetical protein